MSGGKDNVIVVWDSMTWQIVRTIDHRLFVTAIAFTPDGTTLASAELGFGKPFG